MSSLGTQQNLPPPYGCRDGMHGARLVTRRARMLGACLSLWQGVRQAASTVGALTGEVPPHLLKRQRLSGLVNCPPGEHHRLSAAHSCFEAAGGQTLQSDWQEQ